LAKNFVPSLGPQVNKSFNLEQDNNFNCENKSSKTSYSKYASSSSNKNNAEANNNQENNIKYKTSSSGFYKHDKSYDGLTTNNPSDLLTPCSNRDKEYDINKYGINDISNSSFTSYQSKV